MTLNSGRLDLTGPGVFKQTCSTSGAVTQNRLCAVKSDEQGFFFFFFLIFGHEHSTSKLNDSNTLLSKCQYLKKC